MRIQEQFETQLLYLRKILRKGAIATASDTVAHILALNSSNFTGEPFFINLEKMLDAIVFDDLLSNKQYTGSFLRQIVNYYGVYFENQLSAVTSALLCRFPYFRERQIPIWAIEGVATFLLESTGNEFALPFAEAESFFSFVNGTLPAIQHYFVEHSGLTFLHDPLCRNKTALFLKKLAAAHPKVQIHVLCQNMSVFEALMLQHLLGLLGVAPQPLFFVNAEQQEIDAAYRLHPYQQAGELLKQKFMTQNGIDTLPTAEEESAAHIQPKSERKPDTNGITVRLNAGESDAEPENECYLVTCRYSQNCDKEIPDFLIGKKIVEYFGPELRSSPKRDSYVSLICCFCKKREKPRERASIRTFYKSIRKIKNEEEIKALLKETNLDPPASPDEALICADVYCRAGYFTRAFTILKKHWAAKPDAAYRIARSIITHTANNKLKQQCESFTALHNLAELGFSAELIDALNDEIDKFIREKPDRKDKTIWL